MSATDPDYVDSTVDFLIARLNTQNAVDAERVEGDPRQIAARFFDGQTVYVLVTAERFPALEWCDDCHEWHHRDQYHGRAAGLPGPQNESETT